MTFYPVPKVRFVLTVSMLIAAFLNSSEGNAQERISIKDPELTFSYARPADWVSDDGDLYHYIRRRDEQVPDKQIAEITITYYEGRCQDLDQCFDGETNGYLPENYASYKKLSEGEELIAGERAKWIKFGGTEKEKSQIREGVSYLVVFIKYDQYFVLRSILFDPKLEEEMWDVLRSFEVMQND